LNLISERKPRMFLFATVGGLAVVMVLLAIFLVHWSRRPGASPLEKMQWTEAQMDQFSNALNVYYTAYKQYPTMAHFGRVIHSCAILYSEGKPLDAWGHPFAYVPAYQLDEDGSPALANGSFYPEAPYQLYSRGADGDAGNVKMKARVDNITSWEKAKPWRKSYEKLEKDYQAGKMKK